MEKEKEYYVIYEDSIYNSPSMNKLKIAIFTEEECANKMMEILKKESSKIYYTKEKVKESDLSSREKFDFIDYYKSNIDKGLNVYSFIGYNDDIISSKISKVKDVNIIIYSKDSFNALIEARNLEEAENQALKIFGDLKLKLNPIIYNKLDLIDLVKSLNNP